MIKKLRLPQQRKTIVIQTDTPRKQNLPGAQEKFEVPTVRSFSMLLLVALERVASFTGFASASHF